MPDMYVTSFIAAALAASAQAFRVALSRVKLHNSLRVYRQKAIAEGVCAPYDRILGVLSQNTSQSWWKKVDSRIPGKAYREAVWTMANRRQIESPR